MRITIEKGVVDVRLMKSEEKALETVRSLCKDLAEYVSDAEAATVAETLLLLQNRYVEADASEETGGDGE